MSCTETSRNNLEERKSKLHRGGRLESRTYILRGGADKSLAQPTSRCRRTESVVSLERGICLCAELQDFLVTEAERKHVTGRARFQQHGGASCHFFFSERPGAEGNSRLSDRNITGACTIVCHRQKLGGPV